MPDETINPEDLAFWRACFAAALTGVAMGRSNLTPEATAETAAEIAKYAVKEERKRRRDPTFQMFGGNRS